MNDTHLLEKWGWIERKNFLWWNFNYPKEERRYFEDPDDFFNEFQTVGEVNGNKINVTTSDYVPVTTISPEINGNKIELMLTARPFTPRELNQYFGGIGIGPPLTMQYFFDSSKINTKEKCIDSLKKVIPTEGFAFADHFLPHIRGFVREVNEDSIFYHSPYNFWYGEVQNREVVIKNALEKLGIYNLEFVFETYVSHNVSEAANKSIEYCGEKSYVDTSFSRRGKLKIRKPLQFPKFFEETTYDEISLEGNEFAYYPLLIEGEREAIPFAICNNFYGDKGFFIAGVSNGSNSFYPLKNENLLMKASSDLSNRLEKKIIPICFSKVKGSLKPYRLN